jgi:tRNA-Thr(GGU) m(6)t(6)A37 methyltransferase TsaA
MIIEPIGIIHSPHQNKDDCPLQPIYADKAIGRVEVFEPYAAGLQDIETFSHIYLIYQFDRSGEIRLIRQTFLDDHQHGIFATRHPCRPNGIGISIVKLLERCGNMLVVEGIDVLDQTPLIDLKPYVARFDNIAGTSEGWMETVQWRPKPEGRE